MTPREHVESPSGWVRPFGALPVEGPVALVVDFCKKTLIVAEIEVRKLAHDPTKLATRAVQPVLWLLIFGQVFTQVRSIPTGGLRYLDFMAPGILAQSVLFIAIFYGIHTIWERDLGILHKFLVSPAPHTALVLGKAISAGIRSLSQAILIYALALLLGIQVNWNIFALIGVLLAAALGAAFFACMSITLACLVKNRDRFMGIGQVMSMPLFFASNAIYPISIMPAWLQLLSHLNPLTYQVDALRALMIIGGASTYGLGFDFAVLAAATAFMVILAGRLYPTVIR